MSCSTFTLSLTAVLVLASTVYCRPGPPLDVGGSLEEKAYAYYTKLHQDYLCHLPQERVIPVQQIHPANSVSYTTGSVVLHRCAEDTGCCAPREVCVAKDTKNLDIPILVTKVGDEEGDHAQTMTFVDHASCHCVPEDTLTKP